MAHNNSAPLVEPKPWRPQPGPQTWFCECPLRDVFVGGARFGGKTNVLLGDFLEHAIRWQEHAKGILFRRTFTELEEVIAISKSIFLAYGATYNEQNHQWKFPWGATLFLRFLRRDSDAAIYQGWSVTWLGFDEAGNWPSPKPIDELWAILRSVHIPLDACTRRLSGNPGGPGHAWLMARYVLDEHGVFREPMVPFWITPLPLLPDLQVEACYIPATLDDNLLADRSEYERTIALAAHGNPTLYRAWRYGDWTAFVGQAFHEWAPDVHVVPNRLPARASAWAAGLDWGYDQGWIGLAAKDSDGRWEVVHEIYFRHVHARQAALEFARRWDRLGQHPEVIYADEQMWQVTGRQVASPQKIVDEFQRGLLDFYRSPDACPLVLKAVHGPGSRKIKYNAAHAALAFQRGPDGSVEPWNRPRLTFQRRCVNAIRTIPSLPEDPDRPGEDVDTDAEDHPYDGVMNLILSDHPAPQREPQGVLPDRAPGFTDKGRRRARDETKNRIKHILEGTEEKEQSPYHYPSPDELVPV